MSVPEPKKNTEGRFDSLDCVDVLFDGPADTTVRPMRPDLKARAIAEQDRIRRWEEHRKQQADGNKAP